MIFISWFSNYLLCSSFFISPVFWLKRSNKLIFYNVWSNRTSRSVKYTFRPFIKIKLDGKSMTSTFSWWTSLSYYFFSTEFCLISRSIVIDHDKTLRNWSGEFVVNSPDGQIIMFSNYRDVGWILYFQGTAATKVKMAQKEAQGVAEKRKGRRGPGSVIGSSAAGCVCAFLTIYGVGGTAFSRLWELGFVASFCTKLSDTVSSEIGKAYGKTTWVLFLRCLVHSFIYYLMVPSCLPSYKKLIKVKRNICAIRDEQAPHSWFWNFHVFHLFTSAKISCFWTLSITIRGRDQEIKKKKCV